MDDKFLEEPGLSTDVDKLLVANVINSMTDEQKKVLYYFIGQTWYVSPDAPTFIQHLAKLTQIALSVTHKNFVTIQKLRSDILNGYKTGKLSDSEKRTLYNAAAIIMDYMRKELK